MFSVNMKYNLELPNTFLFHLFQSNFKQQQQRNNNVK